MARDTFTIDVKKFGAKTDREMRLTIRRVALDVFGEIVKETPVGNPDNWRHPERAPPGYTGGRARGNWQTTVARPAEGVIERKQTTKKGAVQIESELTALAWDGVGSIFITNNLPYIKALEEGHSTQAPTGWIRTTLAQYPGIVRRRADEARRR